MAEGIYITEYIVDDRYLVSELKRDCNLELVSSDNLENQYIIHEEYFKKYSQFEDVKTKKVLKDVSEFYVDTNINVGCRPWFNLFRFYVFRKNDEFEEKKQKGGGDLSELLNFSNKDIYYVPNMNDYNNNFSFTNSLHHIMKSHKVIPKNVSTFELFNDLNIGKVTDKFVDKQINKISKNMIISEINEFNKEQVIVDGINIFIVERDCNDYYDVSVVKKSNKIRENDLSVVLMKEGLWYVPVYHIEQNIEPIGKKNGLFNTNHSVIQALLEEL
jgi:hypothetical protein